MSFVTQIESLLCSLIRCFFVGMEILDVRGNVEGEKEDDDDDD